jgi:HSP20 family protein
MTNLTRWDPFNDMLTLCEAMNQLFEESFVPPTVSRRGQGGFVPALDLSETVDGYRVEVAAPGMKPEDVQITLENNVLTIKGELRQETQDKQRNYHRVERRYGAFQRTIALPSTVKADGIQAELNNGILRLEIPKAEEVKPRRISVNVAPEKSIEVHKN